MLFWMAFCRQSSARPIALPRYSPSFFVLSLYFSISSFRILNLRILQIYVKCFFMKLAIYVTGTTGTEPNIVYGGQESKIRQSLMIIQHNGGLVAGA